ncbi:Metallo-beta-lactamase [Erythrobacter sp. EC-HK427]|nr:Metallo-beta-lactamase [Erythrobacter sp. EC-HK427]
MSVKYLLAALAPLFLSSCVAAQTPAPQPDPDPFATWTEACEDWGEWDKPGPPFRVHGNTYYVGTCGIAVLLVANGDQLVLLDTGTAESSASVIANIRALGFRPSRIEAILVSHEHFDHVGGLASMQAEGFVQYVVTGHPAVEVLTTGFSSEDDPQHGIHQPMASAQRVQGTAGEGPVTVTEVPSGTSISFNPIVTPGHTPGALTWQWESCNDEGECLTIVYADSLSAISSDDYRFSDHPDYVEAFRDGLARLMELDCDILLTPHPSSSGMRDKLLAGDLTSGMNCAEYAELMDTRLSRRLAEEAGAAQ